MLYLVTILWVAEAVEIVTVIVEDVVEAGTHQEGAEEEITEEIIIALIHMEQQVHLSQHIITFNLKQKFILSRNSTLCPIIKNRQLVNSKHQKVG